MDGDTRREGHTERFLILAPRQNDHQPPGTQSETRAGNGNPAVYQLPRSIRALPSSVPSVPSRNLARGKYQSLMEVLVQKQGDDNISHGIPRAMNDK